VENEEALPTFPEAEAKDREPLAGYVHPQVLPELAVGTAQLAPPQPETEGDEPEESS
jgi:hypothetical protein